MNRLAGVVILATMVLSVRPGSAAIQTGAALQGVVQDLEAVSGGMHSALTNGDSGKAGTLGGGLYEGTSAGKTAIAAAIKEQKEPRGQSEGSLTDMISAGAILPSKLGQPVRIAGMDGPSCIAWGTAQVCVNREVCRIVSACVGGWAAANTAGGGLVWVACLTQTAQEVCSSVPECASVPVCTQWRN